MSYEDAKRDNIETIKDRKGFTAYLYWRTFRFAKTPRFCGRHTKAYLWQMITLCGIPRCRIYGHSVFFWGYQSRKVYICRAYRRKQRNAIS